MIQGYILRIINIFCIIIGQIGAIVKEIILPKLYEAQKQLRYPMNFLNISYFLYVASI